MQPPKKKYSLFLLALLFVLVLALFSYQLKFSQQHGLLRKTVLEIAAPLESAINDSVTGIEETWHRYLFLYGLTDENKRLRETNARLARKVIAYREAYLENIRLRRLLAFKEKLGYETVAAGIILRDMAGFMKTLMIDRGESHGVRRGQPVIVETGLMGRGFELGLVGREDYERLQERIAKIHEGIRRLSGRKVHPTEEVSRTLATLGTAPIKNPLSHFQLLRREEINYDDLKVFPEWDDITDPMVKRQIEIEAKYEGYIKRQYDTVRRMKELEAVKIPPGIDYGSVSGLSNELKGKLTRVEPATIGQAERIPGMTQAAIMALLVTMKKMEADGRK